MVKFSFSCVGNYIVMRQEFEKILGEELRYLAIETRDRLGLTQKEMGEHLQMVESSYSDIETGQTICCSALTEILLLKMQNNPKDFVDRVTKRFAELYEEKMQPIL